LSTRGQRENSRYVHRDIGLRAQISKAQSDNLDA